MPSFFFSWVPGLDLVILSHTELAKSINVLDEIWPGFLFKCLLCIIRISLHVRRFFQDSTATFDEIQNKN